MPPKRRHSLGKMLESKRGKLEWPPPDNKTVKVKKIDKKVETKTRLPFIPKEPFVSDDEADKQDEFIEKRTKPMCKVSRDAGKSRGSKKEKIDDLDLSSVESNSDIDEDDELEGNIQQLSIENDSKEESFFTTVEQFIEASPESRELIIKKKFSKFDSTSILNEFIDGYKIAKAEGNTSDSDVWTICLGALIKSEVDKKKVEKRLQIIENSTDQVFRQLAFASIIDFSPELGDVEVSVDSIYTGKGKINVSDALRTVAKTSCSLKIIINRVAKAWIRAVLYEEDVPLYTTSINPHGYHTLPADRITPVKKWLVSTISVAPTEDRIDPSRLPFVIGDAFEKQLNYIFHQSRATKKKEAKRHSTQPSTSSTASNYPVNDSYASDPYERNGLEDKHLILNLK